MSIDIGSIRQDTPAKRRSNALAWLVDCNDKARSFTSFLRRRHPSFYASEKTWIRGERPREFRPEDWERVAATADVMAARYRALSNYASACCEQAADERTNT
jgi:hypothetical protein